MSESVPHFIEKQIDLKAPPSKVWQALTDSALFGQWFKVKCEGPFVVGEVTYAMNQYPGHEHRMALTTTAMRPETYFAYTWTPYPFDKTIDYSKEKPTLVEFRLETIPGGTRLHVKESGFDHVTARRRAKAFEMHSGGWDEQLKNIEAFLA